MSQDDDRPDHARETLRGCLVGARTFSVRGDDQPFGLELFPHTAHMVVTEVLTDRERDSSDRRDKDGDLVAERDRLEPAVEPAEPRQLAMLAQLVALAVDEDRAVEDVLVVALVEAA